MQAASEPPAQAQPQPAATAQKSVENGMRMVKSRVLRLANMVCAFFSSGCKMVFQSVHCSRKCPALLLLETKSIPNTDIDTCFGLQNHLSTGLDQFFYAQKYFGKL